MYRHSKENIDVSINVKSTLTVTNVRYIKNNLIELEENNYQNRRLIF